MTIVVLSADPLLRRLLDVSPARRRWRWIDTEGADFALAHYEVAILDSLALKACGPRADGHLLLARRLQNDTRTPRFLTEVHPRSAFEWLLETQAPESPLPAGDPAALVLGASPAIELVRDQIRRVAKFPRLPVLLLGETGTGKEVVARAIHAASKSQDGGFVGINCAAVPANLFEAELFGVASGAYTGAAKARPGLFEHGGRGTVFLDEIGDLPFDLQPKLLRALEERSFRRLGSNEDIPLAARIVSATHRNAARSHVLRRDLFYRLSGFTICIPPLSERLSDAPLLARSFVEQFALRHGVRSAVLETDAEAALLEHQWPGNVRELRAVVERAAILCDGLALTARAIREAIRQAAAQEAKESVAPKEFANLPRLPSLKPPRVPQFDAPIGARDASTPTPPESVTALRAMERTMTINAFERSGRNLAATARELGLPRSTVRDRLKRGGAL